MVSLRTEGATERIEVELVGGDYFRGLRPILGRALYDTVDTAENGSVVVSYRFWRHHFDGDRDVVGRQVTLSGRPWTVVGVAPRDFRGLNANRYPQMWLPVEAQPMLEARDLLSNRSSWLYVAGWLQPGIARERLRRGMAGTAGR